MSQYDHCLKKLPGSRWRCAGDDCRIGQAYANTLQHGCSQTTVQRPTWTHNEAAAAHVWLYECCNVKTCVFGGAIA